MDHGVGDVVLGGEPGTQLARGESVSELGKLYEHVVTARCSVACFCSGGRARCGYGLIVPGCALLTSGRLWSGCVFVPAWGLGAA